MKNIYLISEKIQRFRRLRRNVSLCVLLYERYTKLNAGPNKSKSKFATI